MIQNADDLRVWQKKMMLAELEDNRAAVKEIQYRILEYHRLRIAKTRRFVLLCEQAIDPSPESGSGVGSPA